VLGLLDQGLLETPHTLAEARVIFELAQRPSVPRSELQRRLAIDASFLTRVLTRLERKGLVASSPSPFDGRARDLTLTATGREAFEQLDQRSARQIAELVTPLTVEQRASLVESMAVVAQLLPGSPAAGDVAIRGLAAGDLGWVIQRNGAIYADEFGWDREYEALVARIVADFQTEYRPDRERVWIAEIDGARAGCVFCRQKDERTAQLRLLLVEPWARGRGLGARLVDECVGFAAAQAYSKLMLWTNDVLAAARRIYEAAGFVLVAEEPHHSFGKDLVGQIWELDLDRAR